MMPADKFQAGLNTALGAAHDEQSRILLEANGLSYEDAINDPNYLNNQGFELMHKRHTEDIWEFVLCERVATKCYSLNTNVSTTASPAEVPVDESEVKNQVAPSEDEDDA